MIRLRNKFQRTLRDCSVKTKLRILTVVTVATTLSAVCLAFVWQDVRNTHRAKAEQLSALARVLAANTTAALEFDDRATAEELLGSLRSQPSLELACLYRRDGTPFATYSRADPANAIIPPAPEALGVVASDRGHIDLADSVEQEGVRVGTIRLRANLTDVQRQVMWHVLIAGAILLVALLASVILADRLQRLLTVPLQDLVGAMKRVTVNDDFSVRLDVQSRDEVGVLAEAFNVMLGEIETARQSLQAAHDELEIRVERRTAQLRDALESAESANRTKTQFLANMSHEIRTPMTAILGFADLLLDHGISAEDRECIQTIRRNGAYLLTIINDILDLSRIEAGKMVVERSACSPCGIVADVVSLMRVKAEEKNLTLTAEFRSPLPEVITSDATRLRQILINLIGNAVKFSQQGEVRVVVRMLTPVHADDPRLGFEVIDTGIGMSADQLANVFEPFSQADESMSRLHGGTGLGLAISRRFAELLGGQIVVESTPGEGSRFLLAVQTGPLDHVRLIDGCLEAISSTDRDTSRLSAETRPLRGRILLAEDGPDNQRLIQFVLNKAGANVTVAENGRIAVEEFLDARGRGRPFDCILMDMQMPILDGYEATRRLRNEGCSIPIIALTAHAMGGDRERCLRAGCDDYASKPIDRAAFVQLVGRYLRASSTDFTIRQ